MQSKRKMIVNLAKFAIPVAIIGILVYRIKPAEWEALHSQPKDYALLAGALLIALVAVSLSFARWCLLVRCQGIEFSMLEAFRLGSICFLLNFVSVGSVGGDLFKAVFLARRRPGKRVAAVASVVVDRGVGLYGLLLIGAAALLFHSTSDPETLAGQNMGKIKAVTATLLVTGTIVLSILVFGGRMVDRLIGWGSEQRFIGGLVQKIGPPLRMFHHHPIAFAASVVMSVGVHGLLTISMYFIARGLYSDIPTLQEHLIIVPIAMLASAMPFAPAGLGVLEATMEWLYDLIPAKPTEASGTLVALVFEVVKVVLAAIGTIFYWSAGKEIRESLEEVEHEEDAE